MTCSGLSSRCGGASFNGDQERPLESNLRQSHSRSRSICGPGLARPSGLIHITCVPLILAFRLANQGLFAISRRWDPTSLRGNWCVRRIAVVSMPPEYASRK